MINNTSSDNLTFDIMPIRDKDQTVKKGREEYFAV
jgi:hypothetical protein